MIIVVSCFWLCSKAFNFWETCHILGARMAAQYLAMEDGTTVPNGPLIEHARVRLLVECQLVV